MIWQQTNLALKQVSVSDTDKKQSLGLMPVACTVFCLWIAAALFSSRCLYADGAHEFIRTLEAQNFVTFMWSRHFAFYIYEFPLVLAIKLGVTNMACLRLAFGLGCFLPWPLAMFCCWRISPANFWLVAVACAAGYMNSAFMAVGEHILAHALFWPAIFALLFARPLNVFAGTVLLFSVTALIFSYESQAVLCVPLALLALWRAWEENRAGRRRAWTVFLLATGLLCAGIAVGIYGIIYPELPNNLTAFKSGTLGIFGHMGWTFSWTVAWAGLMLGVFFSETIARLVVRKPVIYLLFTMFLVWGMWPWLSPGALNNAVQYDDRALDLIVPMALLPVALLLRFRPQWLAPHKKILVSLVAALWIAQSLWQISATVNWYRDVVWMQEALGARRGIIPLHQTILQGDGMLGRDRNIWYISGRFEWVWPCLSIALSDNHHINSLICSEIFLEPYLNPAGQPRFWEPFNPLKPETFPKLDHYAIDFVGYTNVVLPQH